MDHLISKGIKVDAIITDPPYGVTNFKWDSIIPFDDMWERLIKLIKPEGAIVLFGNEPFSSDLRNSNKELYRYDWKWIKYGITGFQNAKYQPLRAYEDIMVFSKAGIVPQSKKHMSFYPQDLIAVNLKNKRKKLDYLGNEVTNEEEGYYIQEYSNYPRNVIQFKRDFDKIHPTQKPLALMEYIIKTYSNENETILDFTSGSGSTLIASERVNRKWIGIEITDKYCKVIKDRFKKGIQLNLLEL